MANLLNSIIDFIGNRGVFKDGNGDVELTGSLTVGGHSSSIGDVISESISFNVPTGGSHRNTGCEVTLPPGTWSLDYHVSVPSSATTGLASINMHWKNSGSSSDNTMARSSRTTQITSLSTLPTHIGGSVTVSNPTTTSRVWTLYVFQNSGNEVNATCDITATRIE